MTGKFEEKLKKVMAKTFNCKIGDINKKTSIHQLQRWDSISHYQLVNNLEKEFKIKFDSGEPETMVSYKIIFATIRSYDKKK